YATISYARLVKLSCGIGVAITLIAENIAINIGNCIKSASAPRRPPSWTARPGGSGKAAWPQQDDSPAGEK
ncbi:MAG: hypothetical protein IJJ23_02065, partial [Clostridia bacterium]|nr:hypothetical protein [Clostridia bacterium]